MPRTEADIEEFINDLDTDEVAHLVEVVAGLNPLEQADGKPKYTAHEINLIQRFHQFVADHPVAETEADEDGLEPEDVEVEDDENTEDIPGTGETDEEYVERTKAKGEGSDGNAHNLTSGPDDVSDLVRHDFEAGIPNMKRVE